MARTPTPAGSPPADTPPTADTPISTLPVAQTGDRVETDDHARTPVRVLVAFGEHEANAVIQVTEAELRVLERAGQVDADPEAVAYAESLIA